MSASQSATFPAAPTSARAARDFLRTVLPDLASDVIDVVLLLVTELVTNAVVHAQTSVRVCVEISGSRVRIDVQDEATIMPGRRPVSVESLGGRGLLLVEGLADRWGYEPHPWGKTVWFEIDGASG
ncbi:MAG TPA: ATP-binding protein [Actinomycetes bacterium]|nr:ATP-binding protein [Actinomycetes bacterium]